MKLLFSMLVSALIYAGAGWSADKPAAAAPKAPPAATAIKGTVLEIKEVDAYTYLRLKTKDGESWAAVPKATIKKGAEVTIENPMFMSNFESKTLKQKFDKIIFGSLAGFPTGGEAMAPHAATPAAPVTNVKVAKATGPNARTVAEVISRREELKDKTVLVRGTVVKYNSGILDRNWVHLRDGSGSAADSTDDLLVTTKEQTKIGDVVTVKGVVHTKRDLGSGYTYEVLVEDATLQK